MSLSFFSGKEIESGIYLFSCIFLRNKYVITTFFDKILIFNDTAIQPHSTVVRSTLKQSQWQLNTASSEKQPNANSTSSGSKKPNQRFAA